MDNFLIKRPMNSDDESAIETKVRKVSEMSSDVKTSRKVNKKDRKYQDSYIKFGFTFDVEKGEPKCVICLERLASERNLKISEELIDLSSDENLRIRFQENACDTFWISIKSEYPELSKQAISILLPFASTYLCGTAFSTLTIIKNKYRSRLNVEADLRVAVSNIKPNIESIMSTMQTQVSH
ncbi:hypothetical protein QTP88_020538 [Uroleucon formosanum]